MSKLFKQMIEHNQAFSIDDAYFTNWKNYSMNYHAHSSIELNYVTSGTCIYYVDSKRYILKKKNLLILDSSIPHKLEFCSPEPCLILGMSYNAVEKKPGFISLNDLITTSPSTDVFFKNFGNSILIQDFHSVYPVLQLIYKEFRSENNSTYQNLLLNKSLIDMSRLVLNDDQQSSDYIEMIKDYIQFNYFSINNLDDIANYIGLNKIYMQRIFKQYTNLTVWNYLTDLRMKKAIYLLENTDIPIGDIDENVGINSRQNFYILFKKTYGLSPNEYKNLSRKKN